MSHSKEREEKNCLNCGTALTDRYCQHCGQENTEPKETVWTLVSHFFNDITHFDGKFFSTGKYLITRPGFLPLEYIKGRRASYLHPIRMYVFTSAIFFIIFFTLFNPNSLVKENHGHAEQLKELTAASASLKERLPEQKDSTLHAAVTRAVVSIDARAADMEKLLKADEYSDSIRRHNAADLRKDKPGVKVSVNPAFKMDKDDAVDVDTTDIPMQIDDENMNYRSKLAYEEVQKELPAGKRDGWIKRGLINRMIIYKTKYKDDEREARVLIMERLMHMVPQALFVSLPVFALILMLLYSRRKFYYADHAIFTIHFYCAAFLILLLYFGFDRMETATGWGWISFVKTIFVLALFFYLYKAMRNFYQQRRLKTVFKFILLNIFSMLVVIVLIFAITALSVARFS